MSELEKAKISEKDLETYSLSDLNVVSEVLNEISADRNVDEDMKIINKHIVTRLEQIVSEGKIQEDDIEYVQKYVGLVEDSELKSKVQNIINDATAEYAKNNNLDSDISALYKKDDLIAKHLDKVQLYNNGQISEQFEDLSDAINNIDFVDNEDNSLNKESQREHIEVLFEASKLDAFQELMCDSKCDMNYLTSEDETFLDRTVNKIKNIFIAKIGQAGIASTYKAPSKKESSSPEAYAEYLEKRASAAKIFMQKLSEAKGKVKIKSSSVEVAVADTDTSISKFLNNLQSIYNTAETNLSRSLAKLKNRASVLWNKSYEVTCMVVKNIKDNKWQHITNTVATAGMWATTILGAGVSVSVAGATLPVVGIAVGSYALYSTAGGYVWPVVAEAQQLRAKAKEQGQKLGFWASMKSAWKNKKDDKKYKNRARWGILGGVIGAGAGFFGFSLGLDTVVSKVVAGLARTTSSMAAQTLELIYANKDYAKDPSEENLANLKGARTSFKISAVISGIGSYLSLNTLENNTETVQDVAETVAKTQKTSDTAVWPHWKDIFKGKTQANNAADTLGASAETGLNASSDTVAAADSIVRDTQTGMELAGNKTFNGVKEIYLKDSNGNSFVRYEGLRGGIDTKISDATYAKLIDTINSKGNLNFTISDGSSFAESIDIIRNRIAEGKVTIPEGMHPNHAIYLALMDKRYTGDMSLLDALKCGEGVDLTKQLLDESKNYSTNGHIGTLITEKPLKFRAGAAANISKACEEVNHMGVVSGRDANVTTAENDVAKEVITKSMPDVKEKETAAMATSLYRGSKHDYAVDINSLSGKVMDVETKGEDFFVRLYDKDGAIVLDDAGKAIMQNGQPLISGAKTGVEVIVKNPSAEFLAQNNIKIPRRFQDEISSYVAELNEAKEAANTPIITKGMELTSVKVDLDGQMREQIGEKGIVQYTVGKNGEKSYYVAGVSGVSRFQTEEFIGINMENASVAEVAKNGNDYVVNIATEDKQALQVVVNPEKATVLLNGKDVVLDEKTATVVENIAEKALESKNVKVDLDLTSTFNEKVNNAKEIKNPIMKAVLKNFAKGK